MKAKQTRAVVGPIVSHEPPKELVATFEPPAPAEQEPIYDDKGVMIVNAEGDPVSVTGEVITVEDVEAGLADPRDITDTQKTYVGAPEVEHEVPALLSTEHEYRYDRLTNRYIDPYGHVVFEDDIIAARDTVILRSIRQTERTVTELIEGKLDGKAFITEMRGVIKETSITEYLLGLGGQPQAQPGDLSNMGNAIKADWDRLQSFAQRISEWFEAGEDELRKLIAEGIDKIKLATAKVGEIGDYIAGIAKTNPDSIVLTPEQELIARQKAEAAIKQNAAMYADNAMAQYDKGKGRAWGIDIPHVPPEHPHCRCHLEIGYEGSGLKRTVAVYWRAQIDACPTCLAIQAEYSPYRVPSPELPG